MKRIIRSVLILAVAVGVLVVPPQPAGAQDVVVKAPRQTPNEVLRSAQTVFIHSNSVYFKAESLENSLLQKQEFQDWGLWFPQRRKGAKKRTQVAIGVQ